MNILVLNGSPKGKESVTLHYVKFIQKKFPNHECQTVNVAQRQFVEMESADDGNKAISELTPIEKNLGGFAPKGLKK